MFGKILSRNIWATLVLNFKLLPFNQAIHFPIIVYHRFRIENLDGNLILQTPHVYRGMIRLGSQGSDMFSHSLETIMFLQGNLICKGSLVVGIGSYIRVNRDATMIIEDGAIFGAQNLLFCDEKITFGEHFLSSWQCQIMDTDTHPLVDSITNERSRYKQEIMIGSHSWIGNNVLINKGVILPSNTIVASGSLCNKDYSGIGQYCLLADRPAKVVRMNVTWSL